MVNKLISLVVSLERFTTILVDYLDLQKQSTDTSKKNFVCVIYYKKIVHFILVALMRIHKKHITQRASEERS